MLMALLPRAPLDHDGPMTPSQHHPRGTGDGPGRAPDGGDRRPGVPSTTTAVERERIADDLHAGLAQSLTTLSMQAALLPSLPASPERADAEHRIRGMADQALIDVRRLLTVLRGTDRVAADLPSGSGPGDPLDPAAVVPAGWVWDVAEEDLHALSPSIRVAVLRLLELFASLARDPELADGVVRLGPAADRVALSLVARRAPDAGPRPRGAGAAGLRGLEESLRTRVDAYGGECAVRADADRLRLEVLLPRR